MSEKPTPASLTPFGKPYEGPKHHITRAELSQKLAEINALDKQGLAKRLAKYKDVILGKNENPDANQSSFEMIALYQHAIGLLKNKGIINGTITEIDVDGRFGRQTYESLKTIQEDVLGFKAPNIDGLPGPMTTAAIIENLKGTSTPVPLAIKTMTRVEGNDGEAGIEKTKKSVLDILKSLSIKGVQFESIDNPHSIFTKDFKIGDRVFYIGIRKTDSKVYLYDKIDVDSRQPQTVNLDGTLAPADKPSVHDLGNLARIISGIQTKGFSGIQEHSSAIRPRSASFSTPPSIVNPYSHH